MNWIGRSIAQYEITAKIGEGGMGEVYSARDTRLNRAVAIKILPQAKLSDPDRRRRFLQEAQAASGLNHPNIITVHDLLADSGGDCLVMEYLTGKTLTQSIPAEGLPLTEALAYALQVADALMAAHAAGIIHRDLKPANVMISGQGLVKLLDFGLAKLIAPEVDPGSDATQTIGPMTIEGSLLGTINYMSPEQAEGKLVDARSDIFTYGGVLYEMLSGKPPFNGGSQIATLTAILRDEPAPLPASVPPGLVALVIRCLRKNPAERYQSMEDVRAEVARIKAAYDSGFLSASSGIGLAPQLDPLPVVAPSRNWLWISLGALAVAAGLGAVVWTQTADGPEGAPVAAHQPPPPPPMPDVLTNESVIDMVKAKLPERFIVSQLRNAKTHFNLATPELIRLGQNGVPESVVAVMRDPKAIVPMASPVTAAGPSASSPAPVIAPPAVPGAPPPPAVKTEAVETPRGGPALLADGTRIRLMIDEDIERAVRTSTPLRMSASESVKINGRVAIPAGAPVVATLTITPVRKLLGKGFRALLNIESVRSLDGRQIRIRSRAAGSDEQGRRPIDASGLSHGNIPDGIILTKGTELYCYIDGDFAL